MNLPPELAAKCLELAGLTTAPTPIVDEGATEKQFQADVIREARRAGWRVYHAFNSNRSTPGFPDLVLVRDRVIFAELKTATGKLTSEQDDWIQALRGAGITAVVWRPVDWPAIMDTLSKP